MPKEGKKKMLKNIKEKGYSDIPVADISNDLFKIDKYVRALCTFIEKCDTPMTISIQGDWGSGKTSMMNMMRETMKKTVCPIWFNTWQFSQFDMGDTLVFSMINVLLNELGCGKDKINRFTQGVLGFGKKALKILTDSAIGGEAAEIVGKVFSDNSFNYVEEIEKLKIEFQNSINEKMKKSGKSRIVIFIDDLDRLQPLRAVELLEVLKLFLDCKNVVFVLAVDYEIVTLGIRQKFGNDVDEEKGRSFFDKIIQLPFKIPVSNYDITNYIRNMLARFDISSEDKEIEYYKKLISTSIGFNPRSMKRLFNIFELLNEVIGLNVGNVDTKYRQRVLFAVICAQMCYEKFYLYLASIDRIDDYRRVFNNNDDAFLTEIYGNTSKYSRDEEKLSDFIESFAKALDIDGNNELSDDELNNLKMVLKSSLITSVSSDVPENEILRIYRQKHRTIRDAVNQLLEEKGVTFRSWNARSSSDDGRKAYNVAGYYDFVQKENGNVIARLEYSITRDEKDAVIVNLTLLTWNSEYKDNFLSVFGEDPLQRNENPIFEDARYDYPAIYIFNENAYESFISDIAEEVYRAYSVVKDKLEQSNSSIKGE